MNKELTWEVFQKRNKKGPTMCMLCQEYVETIIHLLIHCEYVK